MTILISHVPKTAGTSLRNLVSRFHPQAALLYSGEVALGNPNIDFIAKFRSAAKPDVVMGHFSYGVHRFLGVQPRYVTVLREPVARVVSLYRYERPLPDSAFAAHFKAGISLRDFVRGEITEMTNNHMCRMIAGIPPDAGFSINEQWLLDLALHNLRRHYILVGTLERFGAFVSALAQHLNWTGFDIPHDNRGSSDPIDLDAATRAAIVDHNALDIRLFEHVMGNIATSA